MRIARNKKRTGIKIRLTITRGVGKQRKEDGLKRKAYSKA